jgi:membrane associated rhomboid family serine protease
MQTEQTSDNSQFAENKSIFLLPTLLVLSLWFIYWVEIYFGLNFNRNGIFPRTLSGLKGIFFSPFIHSGTQHLFNNTSPIFVLLAIILYFYRKIAFKLLVYGTLLTGLFTWTIGRPSYHIGASGVIYMLVSFVFFSGIFRKYYRLVAVSLIMVFLYGSMIWYILPIKNDISWEGHLSGFVVGLIFAVIYKKVGPQKQEYIFKKTEFDDYFDEDGNFAPPQPKPDLSDDL